MSASATAQIRLDYLYKNLQHLLHLNKQQPLFTIIKSDAYGHGMETIAKGIDSKFDQRVNFATSDTDSALHLKQYTPRRHVLHLHGFVNRAELEELQQNGIFSILHNNQHISLLQNAKPSPALGVWLKINTGMNRLGFKDFQSIQRNWQLLQKLEATGKIVVHGVVSHFACADEASRVQNAEQLSAFKHIIQALNSIARVKRISLSNSAALLQQLVSTTEMARPGIGLYGISPFAPAAETATIRKNVQPLLPVMTLSAPIIAKQTLEPGDSAGYGSIWRASKPCQIATVKIGYGDGYPRHVAPKTTVWIHDDFYPIVGRVSMDLITVDISQPSPAKRPIEIGARVELWGEKKLASITATMANTIAYELLCQVTRRVKRIYK